MFNEGAGCSACLVIYLGCADTARPPGDSDEQVHRALVYGFRDEGRQLMLFVDAYQIKVSPPSVALALLPSDRAQRPSVPGCNR